MHQRRQSKCCTNVQTRDAMGDVALQDELCLWDTLKTKTTLAQSLPSNIRGFLCNRLASQLGYYLRMKKKMPTSGSTYMQIAAHSCLRVQTSKNHPPIPARGVESQRG